MLSVIVKLNDMSGHAFSSNDDDSPEMSSVRHTFDSKCYHDGCVEFRSKGDMVGFRDSCHNHRILSEYDMNYIVKT